MLMFYGSTFMFVVKDVECISRSWIIGGDVSDMFFLSKH
jgi:hypothetical protein